MGIDTRYRINGTLNTGNTALANLTQLANACGSWITYDTHEGKFAVVVNQAGTSEWHFDDSNIVGAINIAFTPLDKMYNAVKVTYPHEDLKGQNDWIRVSLPTQDRQANEFENTLSIDYGVVTNPVQAELLGFIEMKQSRVDKVVTFKTDFSKIGVKAGDLFDITSSVYGWTAKMFRVISVSESDLEDGSIEISITGLEYDASVYDENLTRYVRTDSNGITPLSSLPAPTKPTVSVSDSLKTITITTSIIGGIVTELEFMSSSDTTIADNLRSYSLLKTYVSADPITTNTQISIQVESANASTFVCKVRSKNSDGVSQFSLPSEVAYYQGTDIVTSNTKVIDPSTGQQLTNQLGLALLMKLLNSMMGGANGQAQDTGTGSLFKKIIDTMTATGTGANVVVGPSAFSTLDLVYANGSLHSAFEIRCDQSATAHGLRVSKTGNGQWTLSFGAVPPAGTSLGFQCQGFDKYELIANGNGGATTTLVESNSAYCGYTAPGTTVGTNGMIFEPRLAIGDPGYVGIDTYFKNSLSKYDDAETALSGNTGCTVTITGPVNDTTFYSGHDNPLSYVYSSTYKKFCVDYEGGQRNTPGHYTITFVRGGYRYLDEAPYTETYVPGLYADPYYGDPKYDTVDVAARTETWNFVIVDLLTPAAP